MKILIEAGITLNHFLILAAMLFTIGMCGVFINRKSIITILLSIELMLLAVNINFVAFSVYQENILGQVFTIFILTVAAAESAVGLAIIVVYFRNYSNIDIDKANFLKE
ncbi:NADH-quinone oxidoreductase subunit NuoK [Neoehrlichia mikurensis]|uniref:NADH-quinone oxidoreductase subunit K n=1 Tax=Neoehrlichia mikurensis TaxID=89586 RepID=A0A9Q9BZG4_9RICK|nr:NADH-quinone oxidoreductase subunit NuoK [Neoehrlichia mikurensis]QXK91999.1 NADH-quinone oxidoreductase subunit NuoK [Neoehrlichia mikurensis]QXK92456.1 NADH-quinone oxidoreductase subunit NuoK [Neoehrlichia mikurensis]QXK93692.1 NADH-quinone oxidoreductase subunit NuoK [Neoehrlichia mikurensis]UTO55335.1 NADH-quinone oxidoreductase subunit NuoK [Neoehrlichia mikurensis]UTO56256.1 NADH-quinone oxidoreductase subunit NuoK [Neoehrlichia mikurensis]